MKEVQIVNEEIREILEEILYFYKNRSDVENKPPHAGNDEGLYATQPQPDPAKEREEYVNEKYREKIVGQGSAHEGFPERMRAYAFREMDPRKHEFSIPVEWNKKWSDLNTRLSTALSVRNCAAAQLYPPNGFISWHNNQNAPGFNLLFTWSETGAGYFEYIEEDGSVVRLQDRANEWVCRYGHFGSYEDSKYPVVYHCAATDCWRITLGYIFNDKEISGDLQEFVIDEIQTP